ncbi:hypothetical protein [Clostridium thermarum]|uniref:hypothetical protein n=1 Tax=Clostridium thermarum TaxID=1716543 RepID=UPI00112499EB|nr:hypothetical protein [Clostridium thermarum]
MQAKVIKFPRKKITLSKKIEVLQGKTYATVQSAKSIAAHHNISLWYIASKLYPIIFLAFFLSAYY